MRFARSCSLNGAGQCQHLHRSGLCPFKHPGARIDRGSGGQHIIHQQDPLSANRGWIGQLKGVGHIGHPLTAVQTGLRRCVPGPDQIVRQKWRLFLVPALTVERRGPGPDHEFGLIKTALPQSPVVKRHRYYAVDLLRIPIQRQRPPQYSGQRNGQLPSVLVFVCAYQCLEGAPIDCRGPCPEIAGRIFLTTPTRVVHALGSVERPAATRAKRRTNPLNQLAAGLAQEIGQVVARLPMKLRPLATGIRRFPDSPMPEKPSAATATRRENRIDGNRPQCSEPIQ
jgi:hypothetical protein